MFIGVLNMQNLYAKEEMEAKVSVNILKLFTYLIRKVFSMKQYFNVTCFTNETLWLFSFTTKHSWFSTI